MPQLPDPGDAVAAFRIALVARDILPPPNLVADGKLHRCDAVGKNGRGDAAYLLHLDGIPAGGFENWRDGRGWQNWRFDPGRPLGPPEQDALRIRAVAARQCRDAATARRHADAAARALRIWNGARAAPDAHPYLVRKAVGVHGVRVYKGALIVPVCDHDGVIGSLQFISPSGAKRFLKGGRVAGGHFVIGAITPTICVAEGYATAASIHAATGHATVVAFSAGNLVAVARKFRRAHPDARLIVCADDDGATEGNPGLTHAMAAARAVDGWLAVPTTGGDTSAGKLDFNDVYRARGAAAVQAMIDAAVPVTAVEAEPGSTGLGSTRTPAPATGRSGFAASVPASPWRDPEPLTEQLTAFPYPVDALPALLRDAVQEVQAFVQAPGALVAASALAALSVAAQALVDVRRDAQLVGPTSVYLLSVADSGERKSTCDAIFSRPLRDWELERRAELSAEVAKADAAAAAYEAKKTGLLDGIRLRRRKGQSVTEAERELELLVADAPRAVTLPRLLYSDATPEALAYSLANGWPSGAVLSAEAGAVFGSHGMGQDTILRNLALLNVLWDGGAMAIDRRSKPSFQLRGRRLTFGLMVQPEALRGFLDRAGTLPRGTGFLARFLIAWPESMQGSRHYREAPAVLPAVERFARRIRALLDERLVTDAQGALTPPVIALTSAAQAAWISIHDCVEDELLPSGEYRDIRDVASKAAENVARLAALFHVLEEGPTGTVGVAAVAAATTIVTWHLGEARRLLTAIESSPTFAAAVRLDEWLRQDARESGCNRIPVRRVFQFGPRSARDSQIFKTSIALLAERGRARIEIEGRGRYVAVNPALLDVDSALVDP